MPLLVEEFLLKIHNPKNAHLPIKKFCTYPQQHKSKVAQNLYTNLTNLVLLQYKNWLNQISHLKLYYFYNLIYQGLFSLQKNLRGGPRHRLGPLWNKLLLGQKQLQRKYFLGK
ncbi:MAG TPA: hypothetical protein [Caudoviricetes sp.]|nr:MAG TPA: hypothetical protein [Caudoviricetes sp.]